MKMDNKYFYIIFKNFLWESSFRLEYCIELISNLFGVNVEIKIVCRWYGYFFTLVKRSYKIMFFYIKFYKYCVGFENVFFLFVNIGSIMDRIFICCFLNL